MAISWVDILFAITVLLLVMNGLRNGAAFSLISLLTIPVGIAAAVFFGPQFTVLLAANGLPATPLISYAVIFFGVVLILHVLASAVRGTLKRVPIVNLGDALLGALVGFVEAWLLWFILLWLLGNFLHGAQDTVQQGANVLPVLNVQVDQLKSWHDFYNGLLTDSLFARVNGLFIKQLPAIPHLPA